MASHPAGNRKTLHVVIANANIGGGNATVTYDLTLKAFVPPAVRQVDYRLASMDHGSSGLDTFTFHDVGRVDTDPISGDVRLVRDMAVPSVHYVVFEKPTQ